MGHQTCGYHHLFHTKKDIPGIDVLVDALEEDDKEREAEEAVRKEDDAFNIEAKRDSTKDYAKVQSQLVSMTVTVSFTNYTNVDQPMSAVLLL